MVAPAPRGENLADLFGTADSVVDPVSGVADLIGALLAARPPWMADALCQERPEVNFFPVRGEDIRPAKRVCAECLVKVECRQWALAQGAELDGIWSGLSNRQRTQIRLELPADQRPVKARRKRIPTEVQRQRKLRPTGLMDRVSAYLAARPDDDHTAPEINRAVVGDPPSISRALAALTEEGYVTLTLGGLDSRGRSSPGRRTYRHAVPFSVALEPAEAGAVTIVATAPTRTTTAA